MADDLHNQINVNTAVGQRQFRAESISKYLEKVNSAAESWITLLSTLIGVSSIFGLIQSRDSFGNLTQPFQLLLVVVIILTFVTLIIAIYIGSTVGEGELRPIPFADDSVSFVNWYLQSLKRAIYRLRLSRLLGIASFLFLILAFMINLFGPVRSMPGTTILAVQRNGVVVCGTLAKDSAGNLSLVRVGQSPIILKDVVSYNVVFTCP
jgi:hypothetical protein